MTFSFQTVDDLILALQGQGYFADRRLATAVFLALKLGRPLLVEGEPGVGKTELAKALSRVLTPPSSCTCAPPKAGAR